MFCRSSATQGEPHIDEPTLESDPGRSPKSGLWPKTDLRSGKATEGASSATIADMLESDRKRSTGSCNRIALPGAAKVKAEQTEDVAENTGELEPA